MRSFTNETDARGMNFRFYARLLYGTHEVLRVFFLQLGSRHDVLLYEYLLEFNQKALIGEPSETENACQPDEFKCAAGFCIAGYKRCNGIRDCPSGNDEDYCPTPTPPTGRLSFRHTRIHSQGLKNAYQNFLIIQTSGWFSTSLFKSCIKFFFKFYQLEQILNRLALPVYIFCIFSSSTVHRINVDLSCLLPWTWPSC